jgi:hypothetical protein
MKNGRKKTSQQATSAKRKKAGSKRNGQQVKKHNKNGRIIYEGKSLIDGAEIVVIVTGLATGSDNSKTGDMLQTWILRIDTDPITANRTGLDYSICGDCKLRGIADPDKSKGYAAKRSCYVNIGQAPQRVWDCYTTGNSYENISGDFEEIAKISTDRQVRLGSYGDPMAVPRVVWMALLKFSSGNTGYSHQFNPDSEFLMISADTEAEARKAWDKKQRTFRSVESVEDIIKDKEILCPASKEAGEIKAIKKGVDPAKYEDFLTTCEKCQLCRGSNLLAKNVAIVIHGAGNKEKLAELIQLSA